MANTWCVWGVHWGVVYPPFITSYLDSLSLISVLTCFLYGVQCAAYIAVQRTVQCSVQCSAAYSAVQCTLCTVHFNTQCSLEWKDNYRARNTWGFMKCYNYLVLFTLHDQTDKLVYCTAGLLGASVSVKRQQQLSVHCCHHIFSRAPSGSSSMMSSCDLVRQTITILLEQCKI